MSTTAGNTIAATYMLAILHKPNNHTEKNGAKRGTPLRPKTYPCRAAAFNILLVVAPLVLTPCHQFNILIHHIIVLNSSYDLIHNTYCKL